ncbi:hypothetical protein [Roseburia sp. MSJ-14]|uniref:hypothetical protein n=1 Tax=Roseburia sp. MSJ-14 TaxID=2841514 RepID=UPI001C110E6F|nr:hypothetical protein [Roseburia sp. MSJ-14]MBU5473017.1 hypothetical protein [Roseburia sp. MSJ-14]
MTGKKNGFLAFCFSLIPGVGEMYMGFMKQGLSIMGAFWGLIFVASYLQIDQVLFVLPILWCYSLFHVHNLRSLPDEEFYAVEDDYLFHIEQVFQKEKWEKKQKNVVAGVLIFVGAAVLWRQFSDYLYDFLPEGICLEVIEQVPQIVVAVILIIIGIMMIRGKKAALDKDEEKEENL